MKKYIIASALVFALGSTITSCKEKTEKEELIEKMEDEGAEFKVKNDGKKIKMKTEDTKAKIKTDDDGNTKIKIKDTE